MDDKVDLREQIDLSHARWQRPLPSGVSAGEVADSVEVAFVAHSDGNTYVALRPGSRVQGPVLLFTPTEWDAFVAGVRDGEFDQPW